MKHVFTIHSSLTFLVAYATIKHLDLDKSDILLISQSYEVPISDFKVISDFHNARNNTTLKRIENFNVPKAFDKYISEHLDGQDFTAYVDLMSYYQKILITHNNCKSFHFIEEGNSAYQAKDDLQDITWSERKDAWRTSNLFQLKSLMRVLRGYNLRLLSLPYIYSAYAFMEDTKFFAFSQNAFYNVLNEKRVLLRPAKDDNNIKKLAGGHAYQNATIWLDGSNSRYTGLDESFYHAAIRKAVPILKEKGVIKDKVYAKLRPGIVDKSSNKLVSILSEFNIQVEVMPNDLILEAFFMQSENCNVIGVLTAALEYAHVFGHKVYSIYGLFDKQPPTFFDRMTGFWENIENLTE